MCPNNDDVISEAQQKKN